MTKCPSNTRKKTARSEAMYIFRLYLSSARPGLFRGRRKLCPARTMEARDFSASFCRKIGHRGSRRPAACWRGAARPVLAGFTEAIIAASYTDSFLPVFYRLTAFWAGQPEFHASFGRFAPPSTMPAFLAHKILQRLARRALKFGSGPILSQHGLFAFCWLVTAIPLSCASLCPWTAAGSIRCCKIPA